MPQETYQSSDLAGAKRTQFIQEARAGRARLRDKDGVTLIMLPEHDLEVLDQFALWSQVQQRISSMVSRDSRPTVAELGDLAWLRVFDNEDLESFSNDLHTALISGLADRDSSVIKEIVDDWRVSARQLEDPLRKSVLLDQFQIGDFEEAQAPE